MGCFMFLGGFVGFGGGIILFCMMVGGAKPGDVPLWVPYTTLIGTGVFFISLCIDRILWSRELNMRKRNNEIQAFYECCCENGIKTLSDLDQNGKFEKAKLIAEKYSIFSGDLKKYFSQGYELYIKSEEGKEQEKLRKIQEEIDAKAREESAVRAELTRYAEYTGRDKKLAILNDILAPLKKQLSGNYDTIQNSTSTSGYLKEQSWAVHGGIADAIAGPAAGIVTALEVQQKNQQIRNYNSAMSSLKSMTSSMARSSIEKLKPQIEEIEKQINDVKIKLVLEENENKLFKCLKCTTGSCEISETGNFKIEATISQVTNVPIYDNNDTVIDGTILATMYQDNEIVGQAKLVLPYEGTANVTKVMGMSEGNADKNKEFKIVFEPYKLWVIEK